MSFHLVIWLKLRNAIIWGKFHPMDCDCIRDCWLWSGNRCERLGSWWSLHRLFSSVILGNPVRVLSGLWSALPAKDLISLKIASHLTGEASLKGFFLVLWRFVWEARCCSMKFGSDRLCWLGFLWFWVLVVHLDCWSGYIGWGSGGSREGQRSISWSICPILSFSLFPL
jgi:hypothetical protein